MDEQVVADLKAVLEFYQSHEWIQQSMFAYDWANAEMSGACLTGACQNIAASRLLLPAMIINPNKDEFKAAIKRRNKVLESLVSALTDDQIDQTVEYLDGCLEVDPHEARHMIVYFNDHICQNREQAIQLIRDAISNEEGK